MKSRLISVGVALLLFAAPLCASAQSANATPDELRTALIQQLIAVYSQLIQLLEQELTALQMRVSTHTSPNTSQSSNNPVTTTGPRASFSATPLSGTEPLRVDFMINYPPDGYNYAILTGEKYWAGATSVPLEGSCMRSKLNPTMCLPVYFHYTYKLPGIYTASLLRFKASDPPTQISDSKELIKWGTIVGSQLITVTAQTI